MSENTHTAELRSAPDRLTPEREREIRAREAAASAGPWQQTRNGMSGAKLWNAANEPMVACIAPWTHAKVSDDNPVPQWQRDLDFIRHAREDVPFLLAEVRALREQLDVQPTTGAPEGVTADDLAWLREQERFYRKQFEDFIRRDRAYAGACLDDANRYKRVADLLATIATRTRERDVARIERDDLRRQRDEARKALVAARGYTGDAPGHTDLMVSPEAIAALDLPDTTPAIQPTGGNCGAER